MKHQLKKANGADMGRRRVKVQKAVWSSKISTKTGLSKVNLVPLKIPPRGGNIIDSLSA